MKLTDTAAVITGGASGLGEATARHFRAHGAQVTIFDRDATRGPQVADEIGATFAETDVTSEESVQNAIATAKSSMGRITAAVNCAGIAIGEKTVGRNGPHPLDSFQRTIDINLVGSFNVARLAALEIAKNAPEADGARGVIINTASIAAFDGQKGQVGYASSKGGIVGLTRAKAIELAPHTRVNAVAPGLTNTEMVRTIPEVVLTRMISAIPLQRMGEPLEIAELVAYLASHRASYITGQVVVIGGGRSLT